MPTMTVASVSPSPPPYPTHRILQKSHPSPPLARRLKPRLTRKYRKKWLSSLLLRHHQDPQPHCPFLIHPRVPLSPDHLRKRLRLSPSRPLYHVFRPHMARTRVALHQPLPRPHVQTCPPNHPRPTHPPLPHPLCPQSLSKVSRQPPHAPQPRPILVLCVLAPLILKCPTRARGSSPSPRGARRQRTIW